MFMNPVSQFLDSVSITELGSSVFTPLKKEVVKRGQDVVTYLTTVSGSRIFIPLKEKIIIPIHKRGQNIAISVFNSGVLDLYLVSSLFKTSYYVLAQIKVKFGEKAYFLASLYLYTAFGTIALGPFTLVILASSLLTDNLIIGNFSNYVTISFVLFFQLPCLLVYLGAAFYMPMVIMMGINATGKRYLEREIEQIILFSRDKPKGVLIIKSCDFFKNKRDKVETCEEFINELCNETFLYNLKCFLQSISKTHAIYYYVASETESQCVDKINDLVKDKKIDLGTRLRGINY